MKITKLPSYLIHVSMLCLVFQFPQLVKAELPQSSPLLVQSSECTKPSKNEYIYGKYQVDFTYGGISHKSVILMQGSSGKMVTKYYNSDIRRTDTVQQTMTMRSCSFGLMLFGSKPRRPGENKLHPNYIPDNLLIRIDVDGKLTVKNCFLDQKQLQCVPTNITPLR